MYDAMIDRWPRGQTRSRAIIAGASRAFTGDGAREEGGKQTQPPPPPSSAITVAVARGSDPTCCLFSLKAWASSIPSVTRHLVRSCFFFVVVVRISLVYRHNFAELRVRVYTGPPPPPASPSLPRLLLMRIFGRHSSTRSHDANTQSPAEQHRTRFLSVRPDPLRRTNRKPEAS